jgi:hypothetical protein
MKTVLRAPDCALKIFLTQPPPHLDYHVRFQRSVHSCTRSAQTTQPPPMSARSLRRLLHGASDSVANEPMRDGVTLEDLMFTVYHELGIDANKELVAFGTRPIEIIKDGKLVAGLIA